MPTTASALKLKVPDISSAKESSLQIKDIKAWLADLPIASTLDSAKRLLNMIKTINRVKILPHHRAQFIALLVKPINQKIFVLENNYIDADTTLPLNAKLKNIALTCITLGEELAYAYKLLVQDLIQLPPSSLNRELLMSSVFHAISWLTRVIYSTSLIYHPPPNTVWRDLHRLFNFAEVNHWTAISLDVYLGSKDEPVECSLQDLYLQALLFAVADSVRMRPKEMRIIYQILPNWAKSVRLNHKTEISPTGTSFVVRPKLDQPPLHSALVKLVPETPVVELDTSSLIQVLIQILQERNNNIPGAIHKMLVRSRLDDLPNESLERLILAWGMQPLRSFTRTQLRIELPLVVGLNAIYTLFNTQPISQFESASFITGIPQSENPAFNLKVADEHMNIVLQSSIDGAVSAHKDRTPAPNVWTGTNNNSIDGHAEPPPCVTTNTINESLGGFCVDWSRSNLPKVKIGELIGIPAPSEHFSCSLAVIRWIYDAPRHGTRIGMQILARNAQLVTINYESRYEHLPIQCLLIPALQGTNNQDSLLTPPLALRIDDVITEQLIMKAGQAECTIKLVSVLETSMNFTRFSFRVVA